MHNNYILNQQDIEKPQKHFEIDNSDAPFRCKIPSNHPFSHPFEEKIRALSDFGSISINPEVIQLFLFLISVVHFG